MHPHGHCQICLSYFVISEFQVLPCGHGACNSCFEQAFTRGNNKGRCFVCRTEFSPKSGHRIHLQLVDSKVAVLTNTVEGLEKMDADVKLISVRRASERIRKTADEIDCAEERTSLQEAIDDFRLRIVPAFAKFEAETKELEELRKELLRVKGKAEAFDVLCAESRKKDRQLSELRSKFEESERDGAKTVSMAEKCASEILELKEQIEVERQEKDRLETENKNLRGLLERQSRAVTMYKRKLQEHKKEITELTKRNDTLLEESQMEESLRAASSNEHIKSDNENFSSILPSAHSFTPERSHYSSGLSQITNEIRLDSDDLGFNFGMQAPGFSSDWTMSTSSKPQKRKLTSANFPIPLDKRGRPTVSVQTGPVRSRRAPVA